jgi:hypothetical protein
MTIWRKQDIRFDLADDASDHPVATIVIDTPAGRLIAMAEPVPLGRVLTLIGFHVHGDRTVANAIGPANLILLARAFMEAMNVDELVVAGGLRTTGAHPNRTPRPIRFTRRLVADLGG